MQTRPETRSALLRGVLCAAPLLASVGCSVEPVSLALPPDPPPEGSVAACTGTPAVLARLSGIVPTTMLADEFGLWVIASPGADNAAAQSLWLVPKDGSPPAPFLTSETPITSFVVLGNGTRPSDKVFWTSADPSDGDGGVTGSVRSMGSVATGAPVVLASHRPAPGGLVLLDDGLFWVEHAIDPSGQPVAAIVRISSSGGPIEQVQALDAGHIPRQLHAYSYVTSDPSGSFPTIESLVWSTWNGEPGSEDTAEIVDCRLPGPCRPRTQIAGPDAGGAAALKFSGGACDRGICYSGPQGIMAVAVAFDRESAAFTAPQLLAPTDGFVDRFESDDRDVYFVDRATRRLQGVPQFVHDAAAPRILVSSIAPGTAFQVDDACVYWIDPSADSIMMVKK